MKESVRVLRFTIVGTMNALIMAAIIGICTHLLGLNYLITNVIAYVLAQTNNFFWSKYWVFGSQKKSYTREVSFFLIAFGLAYLAQFVLLLILVEGCGMNSYLAQFLGLFVYGFVNFIINKSVTFRSSNHIQ
jgi:putative flippase GtrA